MTKTLPPRAIFSLNRFFALVCFSLAIVGILAGCGKPTSARTIEPVNIDTPATLTANGSRKNPFTGSVTEFNISAEFSVVGVMLFRASSVGREGSIIVVIASVKNGSKEPLILQRPDFTLITESGKAYNAAVRPGGPWVNGAKDLGPDMSDKLMVAFNIPFEGLKETSYFAVGGQKLVRVTGTNPSDTSGWVVCDEPRLVKQTYNEFF
jgi:hypothetical protein